MQNMGIKVVVVTGFGSMIAFQGHPAPSRWAARELPPVVAQAVVAETTALPRPPAVRPLERPPATLARSVETAPAPEADHSLEEGSAGQGSFIQSEEPSAAPPIAAASLFAGEIIRLSGEADALDRLWQLYKVKCGVRVLRRYDFGREWFSIWDRAAEPTIDGPECADLLWRLLQVGEGVRRDLLRARVSAQRGVLDQGTEIGMLRWHSLQWPQGPLGNDGEPATYPEH